MKKSVILAMLTLLLTSTAMMAQTEATSKVIEVKTQSVSTIDGSLSDTYRNVNRYDRYGRMIEWVQYSAGSNAYNGGEVYEYDAEGNLVSDVTSSTKWTYTYGEDGRVAMKTKYTANANGEYVISAYQYVGYDEEGRVLYEANRSTNGQLTDSVRYNYEGALLMTADTYMQSGPTTYSVLKRVRYAYNEAGKVTRSLQMSVYNTSESITRGNGYKYDEKNRLVADTVLASGGDPRYLTVYSYNGDATESTGNEYYRISSSGWLKSEVRTNTYGTISAQRTPTITSAVQASANGPVTISVTAPAETTGYQGYKVIVDHQEYATVNTEATTSLNLRRGTHQIRVVSVYNGVEANTSDAVTVDVDFQLPAVSGVKVRTMEYKYSWTVSVGWNAPEVAEGLHLTGYRVSYPTPWGYNNETTTTNLQTTFTYSGKASIDVEVYAVYAEGESDATVLTIDLTDTNNMVTEHWHNATMTQVENGVTTGTEHYYYLDNNNNLTRPELLSTTIAYNVDGTPLTRYVADHMETNYAKLLSETTDKWNTETKAWDKYEQIEYVYNSYNLVGEKLTKVFNNETHVYETVATEESTYDDAVSGTMPATTKYYTVENGAKTLVQSKTFVHEMDAIGIQRLETATVYDAAGVVQNIVKTYRHATTGTEVHVDSIFTYSPSMNLVQYAKVVVDPITGLDAAYVVCDATGKELSKKVYTASKEYHPTHMAKDLAYAEGKLSWTAPTRTNNLESYTLLADDVAVATIPAGVTEYELLVNIPSGSHDFALVPVYEGADATASAAVNAVYDAPAFLTLAEAKSTTVSSANRNTEFIISDAVLVTGVIGGNCFVEADGVGMMISGITAAEGDIITNIKGKLTKVSYGKNTFAATSCTVVSSNNEVTPLEVSKDEVLANAEDLDARLIYVKRVAIDEAAVDGGNFKMTVNANQNEIGMNLSVTGTVEFVPVANIKGYVSVRTGAMAAMSSVMVKEITAPDPNEITLAEAKNTTVSSANRNTEFTIYSNALVTGVIGGNCFVEADGVGMMISGITAKEGDIITNIKGKLTKVSYGKNTFAATSCTVVSSGNEVTPLEVSKDEVLANAEALDARLIYVKRVAIDEAAADGGNFKMTVNANQNEIGMNLSVTGTVAYVPVANIKGYVSVRTGAMAAMSSVMVKEITAPDPNEITLAEAKNTTVSSANRNTEFTIYSNALVTGVIGGNCFVEADGVGMMISGITATEGDIITNIKGKLTKVSYGKNTFAATSCTVVSSGNEVTPLEVTKDEVLANAEALDARLITVKSVAIDEAASDGGNFKMTVNANQNELGVNLSVTGTIEFVSTADIEGYISVRTGAMAAMTSLMVKNITAAATTSLMNVNVNVETGAIYDLQGRRVEAVKAGVIYIKNGKKFIAK